MDMIEWGGEMGVRGILDVGTPNAKTEAGVRLGSVVRERAWSGSERQ